MDAQAEYLVASLEQARDLPKDVDAMVRAWQRGDTAWFESQLQTELGRDPKLYQSVLVARNRKWVPKIEALLNDDRELSGDRRHRTSRGSGQRAGPAQKRRDRRHPALSQRRRPGGDDPCNLGLLRRRGRARSTRTPSTVSAAMHLRLQRGELRLLRRGQYLEHLRADIFVHRDHLRVQRTRWPGSPRATTLG